MPDHIHVAITPSESVEKAAQFIKGGFSFAAREHCTGEIWQLGYHAHRIVDTDDYFRQLAYIANNPKRKNLVDYPYVHTASRWALDTMPETLRRAPYPGG